MSKHNLYSKLLVLVAVLFSMTATYISYTSHVILAYNDATAHLNTSRRIIDNLTPGLVQIGSVWLPLLHIFQLPFVSNDFLWHSGLSGAIVSGLSFVIASFFLFKLIDFITKDKIASLLASLVFMTNINLLYLQTTAMFEPLLMAMVLGAIYYLARWSRDYLINDIIIAAFFTMLATLTRYDGWAFFLAACVFVLIRGLTNKTNKEGPFFIFIFLATFGIFLWLLYNLLIFSDPLYFIRSEFSAAAQQMILLHRGALQTYHDMFLSFQTYSYATIFNIGTLVSIAFVIGVLVYLKTYIKHFSLWMPFLLLIPYFFNIFSLYAGQSVIWLPILPPHFETYFNIRYGLLMLPAAAFFIGFIATKGIVGKLLVSIIIVGQIILFLVPSLVPIQGTEVGIVTLKDTVSAVNNDTRAASDFLHNNYRDGLILVSSASEDAFIFRCAIPLKYFITEGTGHYWKESLKNPSKHATWIVFFNDKSDRVGKNVSHLSQLPKEYTKVYINDTYQIWKKIH